MRKYRMPEHMGRGYWLIGGVPDNEIIFYLPGARTEETTTAKHRVVNLTTVTPLTDDQTDVISSPADQPENFSQLILIALRFLVRLIKPT